MLDIHCHLNTLEGASNKCILLLLWHSRPFIRYNFKNSAELVIMSSVTSSIKLLKYYAILEE